MGISYDPPSRKWNVVPESIPDTTPKQTSIWVDDNGGNLYAIDVSKDAYWVQQDNKRRAGTKMPRSNFFEVSFPTNLTNDQIGRLIASEYKKKTQYPQGISYYEKTKGPIENLFIDRVKYDPVDNPIYQNIKAYYGWSTNIKNAEDIRKLNVETAEQNTNKNNAYNTVIKISRNS